MAVINTGDFVEVIAREQTPSDIKSGLYYPHFGGMKGNILKLYGEEASILIAREYLPVEVKSRHIESEKAMRQRWLDGLSEDARGRLNQREKDFALNYAILVSTKDLVSSGEGVSVSPPVESAEETTRRVSGADLDAAEAAFIERMNTAAAKKP